MEFSHTPIMLDEVINGLNIKPEGIYLDGTIGGAGHSAEIVKRLSGHGHLYGTDQDAAAIEAATARLADYAGRADIIRTNYENALQKLKARGVEGLDGILLDLGVSSYQLDDENRGFSYRYDTRLDMRMDERSEVSAETIINTYTQAELARIIREYGEEQFAANIAKHIVERRSKAPITTTGELSDIIHAAIPAKMRAKGKNPCKKTFQAIRIECNRELEVLRSSLDDFAQSLNPGGRFCIITFHSLEDRIVKEAFRRYENPCICPPQFPVCTCGRKPIGRVITRKPLTAGDEELKENPRASSAKLRIFEKI
ncbi:MAG: 16S rRNA (cytosine(1402)-N(4))-methyltransferase RsmH [Lachnospiraceae bacterium]|nr:16S rRNA (cytosine(1402)-N(4))-methyltransferase RsmH [Lachnospiraceae bacterium]